MPFNELRSLLRPMALTNEPNFSPLYHLEHFQPLYPKASRTLYPLELKVLLFWSLPDQVPLPCFSHNCSFTGLSHLWPMETFILFWVQLDLFAFLFPYVLLSLTCVRGGVGAPKHQPHVSPRLELWTSLCYFNRAHERNPDVAKLSKGKACLPG